MPSRDTNKCCPFEKAPGRFNGNWTNCIHGLVGRRKELLQQLQAIEDEIWKWEIQNRQTGNL